MRTPRCGRRMAMWKATVGSMVGPRIMRAPVWRSMSCWMNSSEAQTAPAMMSEAPLTNFVREWTTTSAP